MILSFFSSYLSFLLIFLFFYFSFLLSQSLSFFVHFFLSTFRCFFVRNSAPSIRTYNRVRILPLCQQSWLPVWEPNSMHASNADRIENHKRQVNIPHLRVVINHKIRVADVHSLSTNIYCRAFVAIRLCFLSLTTFAESVAWLGLHSSAVQLNAFLSSDDFCPLKTRW